MDQNRYRVGREQLNSDNSFSEFVDKLDDRVIEDPADRGIRMLQHEGRADYLTREGDFSSLEARSASSHILNLGRILGLPENETFDEGLRKVELKRTLEDHYDIFEESDDKMPVYVPERTKEFLDLRLSPETRSDGEYPCTMLYEGDVNIPVFIRTFEQLIEILESDEYREFHESKDNWENHSDYETFLSSLKNFQEDSSIFAIPHIYSENNGVYYPGVEDTTLINTVDNVFAENYDSSYLERTGNGSADARIH